MQPTNSNVEGYDAAPGHETNFLINRLVRDQLPFPYSECLVDNRDPIPYDSKIYTAMIKSNYSYTQSACFDQCYVFMTVEQCGCYDTVVVPVLKAEPCLTTTQIACTDVVWYQYTSTDIKARCTPLCPLECNSITYTMTESQSDYPSESYSNVILADDVYMSKFLSAYQVSQENPNVTRADINYGILVDNIARVTVYYDTSVYEYASEFPSMDGTALLGNLGGNLGLFLGMSVLSIIEILEVFIESAIYMYALLKKNKS